MMAEGLPTEAGGTVRDLRPTGAKPGLRPSSHDSRDLGTIVTLRPSP
jgi:hypothetical protein